MFTSTPLEGNALAVVHEADGLDAETMVRFARETRLSETTFVQQAEAEGADYRNRIFTVGGELPFAGHPSLGTAVAEARRRGLTRGGFVQQTGAGLQTIEFELDDRIARASMLGEPAEFGPRIEPAAALGAVGLSERDGDATVGAPQVVSTGLAHMIAPVASEAALGRARPDAKRLAELLEPLGATVLYLASCEPEAGRARARGFFFAGEDPATGSAAGPLCALLAERLGTDAIEVTQGVEMGRPSRIEARLAGDRVRVGGEAVLVLEGTVTL